MTASLGCAPSSAASPWPEGAGAPPILAAGMEFELSAEQREIKALTREFAESEIEPRAAEWTASTAFRVSCTTGSRSSASWESVSPRILAGRATSSRTCWCSRSFRGRTQASASRSPCTRAPRRSRSSSTGRPSSARHTFRHSREGAAGAFALTEAESGSDAASLRARAERDGDGWRITGRKQWVTNARHAGTFILFARTDAGVSCFIVDGASEGMEVSKEEEKLGLNSSSTADVVLDGRGR